MKIKQLLSMSFGILLVILLLLGLTSITYIHNISDNTEVLYERPHTNLVGMWEAKSRISQTGNGLREMILYNIPLSADPGDSQFRADSIWGTGEAVYKA